MEQANRTEPAAIPVLIITYRRFDLVIRILSKLRDEGFRKVYVTVDDHPRDPQGFSEVERYLRDQGFEYSVKKWDRNVGCDVNVTDGIKWFFSLESSGIILEDDCIPVAGFGKMAAWTVGQMSGWNISFFGGVFHADAFRYSPLYLPFFWGWYTVREFYESFYRFYHQQHSFNWIVRKVWATNLSTRVKLITLINYYAHRARRKGVAWDSELFLFSLISGKPFVTPSLSIVENTGFGDLDIANTHTWKTPEWYADTRFAEEDTDFQQPVQPFDARLNNLFLDSFYRDYTRDLVKLSLTLLKTLLFRQKLPRSSG